MGAKDKSVIRQDTTMTLNGISTGVTVETSGNLGAKTFNSQVSNLSGFKLSKQEMSDGKEATVISVKGSDNVDTPPDYVIDLTYAQSISVSELDLDVNYVDMPEETSVQVECSNPSLSIKRQEISGTHITGEFASNVEPFTTPITISLWFDKPEQIKSTTKIMLTFSAVQESQGGPVQKKILEKVIVNLSENPMEGLFVNLAVTDATVWDGIVVRTSTGENGNVPRGTSAHSPDIIISGTEPLEDPSILENPDNYRNEYDAKLKIGMPNYLYVRGKNFTSEALTGEWNLFYATPQILMYPYLWEQNQLQTSSGNANPEFTIGAGKIGASSDPFTWVPSDTSKHYCMMAVAKTAKYGNPVEGMNKISDLANYMANNANLAQRNVQMIRGKNADQIIKADYNQGAEAATVDLALLFENIPLGTKITASSGTPLDGKPMTMTIDKTESNDFKYGWLDKYIKENWVTTFTIALNFGSDWSGIPEGHHPQVTIRGELVQGTQDKLYHLGRLAEPHPEINAIRLDATGGPVRVIPVGAVTARMIDLNTK